MTLKWQKSLNKYISTYITGCYRGVKREFLCQKIDKPDFCFFLALFPSKESLLLAYFLPFGVHILYKTHEMRNRVLKFEIFLLICEKKMHFWWFLGWFHVIFCAESREIWRVCPICPHLYPFLPSTPCVRKRKGGWKEKFVVTNFQ